jgi:hypothetical protein
MTTEGTTSPGEYFPRDDVAEDDVAWKKIQAKKEDAATKLWSALFPKKGNCTCK